MEMRNQKQDEKVSKAMSEWWSGCLLEDSTTPANVSAEQNNEGGGVLGDHQDLPFANIRHFSIVQHNSKGAWRK